MKIIENLLGHYIELPLGTMESNVTWNTCELYESKCWEDERLIDKYQFSKGVGKLKLRAGPYS